MNDTNIDVQNGYNQIAPNATNHGASLWLS